MALPVATRSFPYYPSGGFTTEDIWGRPTPAPTEVPVSGSTEETKNRLRNVLASTAETALEYIKQRVQPGGPGGLSADEIRRGAYIERDYYGRPIVRYPATAGGFGNGGMLAVLAAGGLLLFAVLRRR